MTKPSDLASRTRRGGRGRGGTPPPRRTPTPQADKPVCQREGCGRSRPGPDSRHRGREHCSMVCSAVDTQVLVSAEKLCRTMGNSPEAQELWVKATSVNDALTEYQTAARRAYSQSRKGQGRLPSPPAR